MKTIQKQVTQDNNLEEVNKDNHSSYNEELVNRGKLYFDLDFRDRWNDELKEMNKGKRGAPYKFPESFIKYMAILHQFIDYRGLEGIARKLADYGLIPYFSDFTTLWNRIHDLKPYLYLPKYKELEIATDGTGLKSSNAGEYRLEKYGNKRKKKFIMVVITADVRTKKLLGISVYVEGRGNSESKIAEKHIKNLKEKRYKISKFYGDGAYDNNKMFNIISEIGGEPAIKIRKNARGSHYWHKGKARRRAVKEYKELGYKEWSKKKEYGKRWNGTEGINSSVKRKFGENMVSKLPENLICEGYQRFWAYDTLKNYGEINMYGGLKSP